jgi:hypothetical protein
VNPPPFLIFPWQRPFLPDLKAVLHAFSGGRPGSALLIVPNNRPRRYFSRLYADEGEARLLPKMLTIDELVSLVHAHAVGRALHTASPLDRVALLRGCVGRLSARDNALGGSFAGMSAAHFLPWGVRLADLLEEMFTHGVEGGDLAGAEYEVGPNAAALLGSLGGIYRAYLDALDELGLTTPGLDRLAACRGEFPPLIEPAPDRPVLIAGFYFLPDTEDVLLKRLWTAGAHVCLHGDPALAAGGAPHFACKEHAGWIQRWGAEAQPAAPLDGEERAGGPRVRFFAGYDGHSQLDFVRETLSDGKFASSTAVVLTDNGMLMPLLHHLPDKNVNISMGYPLARSPLGGLLEGLMRLQGGAFEGNFYWRDLVRCLRHPYLNMLNAGGRFLREALRALERRIRSGSRYVRLPDLLDETPLPPDPRLADVFARTMRIVFSDLAAVRTTGQAAAWLTALCGHLTECGAGIWERFPLDAEAMYRLRRDVIPALGGTRMRDEELDPETLSGILREMLARERVPFEADPLTGTQVLGMLETRLLHFERVIVVDATDANLPGTPAQDPLLPHSLRRIAGLPDARDGESAVAHTLYRLCAGAEEAHFLWQEGAARSSFMDGKRMRSRFVEQFIWREEQKRGKLLEAGTPPLFAASRTARPERAVPREFACTEACRRAVDDLARNGLSATLLDEYLRCPLAFAWKRLGRLREREEVNEGDDPIAVGDCLHKTLCELYRPYLGKTARRGDIAEEDARDCLLAAMEAADLRRRLPPAGCLMLETAGPLKLAAFLKNQPEETEIVALEKELTATARAAGRDYALRGIIDRLDRRGGLLHVLDYKTGSVRPPDKDFWGDKEFFVKAAAASSGDVSFGDEILETLRTRLFSLQLPLYVVLLCGGGGDPEEIGDAAFVDLKRDGREVSLFAGIDNADDRVAAVDDCALLLSAVLHHLANTTAFTARPGRYCAYCSYGGLCGS